MDIAQALTTAAVALSFVAGVTLTGIIAGILLKRFVHLLNLTFIRAWEYAKHRLTVSATFSCKDHAYAYVEAWFARHPRSRKARNMRMLYDEKTRSFASVPGSGLHWLWYRGPMWVRYGQAAVPTQAEQTANKVGEKLDEIFRSSVNQRKDDYTITMLALSPKKLVDFMNEQVVPSLQEESKTHVDVYNWVGYWQRSVTRKRPMDTVYLPEAQKQAIMTAIQNFINREERYMRWGTPYRLGIELRGPTGTGKTTSAHGIAGWLNRPIYMMNLSSFLSDETLLQAFRWAKQDGIIFIEDMDTFPVARKRDNVVKQEDAHKDDETSTPSATPTSKAEEKKSEKITLSGLLNAIDGLGATEGRILIITTNDHDSLDPALVRSARIDHTFTIGPLGAPEVEAMFRNFFPERAELAPEIRAYAEGRVRQTAAVWQKLFIDHADKLDQLMDETVRPALGGVYRG